MNKRVLALAVASACGLSPQVFAHELAFSKTEQIHVLVDGEANTWCKPEITITIQRPTWTEPKPLNTLLSKLPFILGQECANAKVTWKAVDASGGVYATGSGNASNLGLANLSAPAAPVVVAVAAPAAAPSAPVVSDIAVAPTAAPAPAPAAVATVSAPVSVPVERAVATAPAPEAPVTMAASAPVPVAPAPAAPVVSTPATVIATPAGDYGRALVTANTDLTEVADGSGCKWVISKSAMDSGDTSFSLTPTPSLPCPTGYAEGSIDKLRWSIPNTYRGDTWSKTYAHPSGLLFKQDFIPAVKGKALSYLSSNATQALFELGQIPNRGMTVYLAFQRSNYRVLSPFVSDPYYMVITQDESFALDPAEYKRAATEIYQLVKATSPSTVDVENLYIGKSLDNYYLASGNTKDELKIVQNRMGENRGQFYFDAQDGSNFAVRREERRQAEERRRQQELAYTHERVLSRYAQIQAQVGQSKISEAETLAKMAGVIVRLDSPMKLMNPGRSKGTQPLMVHVTGKSGDFYEIDFPRKGRLQSETDIADGWYVLTVANMTPFLALEDGRAIPTFKVYATGTVACAKDRCADKVSYGAVLQKEFPDSGIDFTNWTPEQSQKYVDASRQASVQIQ